MRDMFMNCQKIKKANLENWKLVTKEEDVKLMFMKHDVKDISDKLTLDSTGVDKRGMFYGCYNLEQFCGVSREILEKYKKAKPLGLVGWTMLLLVVFIIGILFYLFIYPQFLSLLNNNNSLRKHDL